MPAELVVADAPFVAYPGGLIVLRCTDWMAGARGTLSSETDARAIAGEVVRDTQSTASSIFSSDETAYQAVDDTLEIDFSALPLLDDMTYQVWFSILIEGDWDLTNANTFRGANQHEFSFACRLGYHGTTNNPLESGPAWTRYYPRDRPHYVIVSSEVTGDVTLSETMFVRAFAQTGTTCELLLDQIFLVPFVVSGTHAIEWTNVDFEAVGGNFNLSGSIDIDNGDYVDGADGGDNNGKFTWMPIPWEDEMDLAGLTGGGDYQKDPDNEYMVRVVLDDFLFLENSVTDAPANAWAYSVHGSNFREAKTWIDDDFARTVTEGGGAGRWGTGPQGFGWFTSTSNGLMRVDGAQGVMKTNNPAGLSTCIASLGISGGGANASAELNAPAYTISGIVDPPSSGSFPGATNAATAKVSMIGRLGAYPDFEIFFNLLTNTWTLVAAGTNTFDGPTATPTGVPVGWKMEILRHRLKVKVWDASGAEPGTWDYDDFPPNGVNAYPYGDFLSRSTQFVAWYVSLSFSADDVFPALECFWDDVLVEYDPYGDPGDMTAVMEQPHGDQVGEIDVPYGAYQVVSWGLRNWTITDAGDGYLDFSAKVWSESGTAELQRAEAPIYWFRVTHQDFTLVPMNWRSAERPGSIQRVLVGDK